MGDFTPQIASTAAVALLGLIVGSMFRLLRLQRDRDRDYEQRIDDLEADRDWCGQQRAVLLTLCQRNGIEIPELVWQQRPQRSRKRKVAKGESF